MSNNDSLANNSQEPENYFSAIPLEERRKIWDRICRPVDKPVRAAPLTDFDRVFQELVGPRLVPIARCEAVVLGLGLQSFSEAWGRVMDHARRYGATHLSEGAMVALDDWIGSAILTAIDAEDRR